MANFIEFLHGLGSAIDPFFKIGSDIYNIYREDKYNTLQMQREDTAVQRRVADLKAAGLNPVLAAGSPAAAGALSSSSGLNSSQDTFDQWIKNPLNREIYNQEKWNTTAAKYNAMAMMNNAYQLADDMYWTNGFNYMFDSRGRPLNNTNSLFADKISDMHKNAVESDLLQSLFDLKSSQFAYKGVDFTNILGVAGQVLDPILDVLDIVGRLRGAFGTRKSSSTNLNRNLSNSYMYGDFTYRRR